MTNEDVKYLKEDIRNYRIENLEAKFDMYKEYLILLINVLITKGFKENYLNELIKIKNEYMWIIDEGDFLLKEILKNASSKDVDAVDNLILEINDSLEKTIKYYYDLIDDLESDLYSNRGYDYKRLKKTITTLVDTYEFRKKLVGLNVTLDDVKAFLNYPEEFWNFIKDKTVTVEEPYLEYDNKMYFYGAWYDLDENGSIKKLRICVPKVIDLKTAQIAIHEFKHAYDIYSKKYSLEQEAAEVRAREQEAIFKDEYIVSKEKRLFK